MNVPLESALSMAHVFNKYSTVLQQLFSKYASRVGSDNTPSTAVPGYAMTLSRFLGFASYHHLFPDLMSRQELVNLYNVSIGEKNHKSMMYGDFISCLGRCALLLFTGEEWNTTYPDASHKVRLLLLSMDKSEKLFKNNKAALGRILRGDVAVEKKKKIQKPLYSPYNEPRAAVTTQPMSVLHFQSLLQTIFKHFSRAPNSRRLKATIALDKLRDFLKDCGIMNSLNQSLVETCIETVDLSTAEYATFEEFQQIIIRIAEKDCIKTFAIQYILPYVSHLKLQTSDSYGEWREMWQESIEIHENFQQSRKELETFYLKKDTDLYLVAKELKHIESKSGEATTPTQVRELTRRIDQAVEKLKQFHSPRQAPLSPYQEKPTVVPDLTSHRRRTHSFQPHLATVDLM